MYNTQPEALVNMINERVHFPSVCNISLEQDSVLETAEKCFSMVLKFIWEQQEKNISIFSNVANCNLYRFENASSIHLPYNKAWLRGVEPCCEKEGSMAYDWLIEP